MCKIRYNCYTERKEIVQITKIVLLTKIRYEIKVLYSEHLSIEDWENGKRLEREID